MINITYLELAAILEKLEPRVWLSSRYAIPPIDPCTCLRSTVSSRLRVLVFLVTAHSRASTSHQTACATKIHISRPPCHPTSAISSHIRPPSTTRYGGLCSLARTTETPKMTRTSVAYCAHTTPRKDGRIQVGCHLIRTTGGLSRLNHMLSTPAPTQALVAEISTEVHQIKLVQEAV